MSNFTEIKTLEWEYDGEIQKDICFIRLFGKIENDKDLCLEYCNRVFIDTDDYPTNDLIEFDSIDKPGERVRYRVGAKMEVTYDFIEIVEES